MKETLLKIIRWVRTLVKEKLHFRSEELPYYITIVLAGIVFATALKLFIELTEGLHENTLEPYDKAVTDFVISFRSDGLTRFFQFFTDMGDRYVYIGIIVALAAYFWFRLRRRRYTIQVTIVLILSTISNVMLKKAINRSRPTLEHLVEVNTLSFPSGHSMSAMAFYGFLIYLCLRNKIQRWLRIVLVTILSITILSIGLSRIYLGVHFPSDVAAGFIGGLIWVAFSAVVLNIFELLRNRRANKTVKQTQ